RGVFDAVDAGLDQVPQGVLGEAVGGDPGAEPVRLGDRRLERLARPAGGQIAQVAVDPVADQLHPAVAAPRLLGDMGDEVLRLDLPGVVADVAAGAGDVPPGPDDLRQVLAVVDPAGVGGRAGVAQQHSAAVAEVVSHHLRQDPGDCAVPDEADVTVGVDESGQDPALDGPDVTGTGGALVGDPTAEHPELVAALLGPDEHPPLD